jgi:hypothetical protein
MSDDRDHEQPSTDTSEEVEERREDWDPMIPETTEPDPSSDFPASEQVPRQETDEESPT